MTKTTESTRARMGRTAATEPLRVDLHRVDTPIGRLLVAATDAGVCGVEFRGEDPAAADSLRAMLAKRRGLAPSELLLEEGEGWAAEAGKQLQLYFAGARRAFDLPLDLGGTDFQRKVWQSLTRIPYGEVRSYKQVAEDIGQAQAVRAIGGANNKNPVSIIVPCHRVIGADGAMVGYGGGLPIKEFLLRHEGFLR